jgi:hypothetical protein
LELNRLVVDPCDLAVDTAGGDDFVPHLQRALEFLHFLLPLLHRHQDHHVENAENDGKRKKRYQPSRLPGARHRY